MKTLAAGIVSLMLITDGAMAAPPGEGVVGVGRGAYGCGEYLQNRRTPHPAYDEEIVEWSYGFISAYNFYGQGHQVKRAIAGTTILAFLDKYCRESPLASISVGVSELVRTFTKP